MNVLALRIESAETEAIRHIVCNLVGAHFTVVDSIDQALHALHTSAPDVILMPALISPAEETLLLTSLRALPQAGHIETLITPIMDSQAHGSPAGRRSWRPWRSSAAATPPLDTTQFIAERLTWSLGRAREKRKELDRRGPARVERRSAGPLQLQSAADRRAHRRFSARELQSLKAARIKTGPLVSLLDVSAGGALFEAGAALTPDTDAILELTTDSGHAHVPFRVLRCQPATDHVSLRYVGACVFTAPLDIDDWVHRSSVVSDSTSDPEEMAAIDALLDAYTLRADRHEHTTPRVIDETVREDEFAERRRHARVDGSFEGRRRGLIDLPIRVHNISEGGCFVDSYHDEVPGRRLELALPEPTGDVVTVNAEVVHNQHGIGFAVRFVENGEAIRRRLSRLVNTRIAASGALERATHASRPSGFR